MWKKVSFKDYALRDKVCISGLMFCIALCGVVAADRYVKNDIRGTCAGAVGVGINTLLAAKCTHLACRNVRRRKYRQREHN